MYATRFLALTLLATAPLAAQHPAPMGRDSMRPGMMGQGMMGQGMMGQGMGQGMMHPGMMDHGMMMHRMGMGMMAATPTNLLRHKDVLQLTAQQVTRLTALRDAAATGHDAAMADARKHHEQLAEVLKAAKPDTAAARTHFEAAHAASGKAHWAMLRAAAQARAVLTDVQRARVDGWADAMRMGHGGGHGHPGGDDDDDDGPHHQPR